MSVDRDFLCRLCDLICNASLAFDAVMYPNGPTDFVTTPASLFNTHAWRLAQAGCFCPTTRLLSTLAPLRAGDVEPPRFLLSVQWLRLNTSDGLDVETIDPTKHATILHALANRAVGFLYMGPRPGTGQSCHG